MEDDYQYEEQYDYDNYDEPVYGGEDPNQPPASLPHVHSGGESQDIHFTYEPYQILPLQKIYDELNTLLNEISEMVYLERGWCLLLLKQFRWEIEYLKEQYFNRMEESQRSIGLRMGLQLTSACQPKSGGTCDICLSEPVAILKNICGHGYCIDCWMDHLKFGITSGNPFLRCMREHCQTPLLMETILFIFQISGIQGAGWIKKYEKKLCEMFITTNKNYQFCTGADCGNCIKVNEPTIQAVTCVCGKIFCFKCQSDDHYPCKCQQKTKWQLQVISEEADAKWIAMNSKVCPWCKKAVERSAGCNFMACRCGKSFCYMCAQPWEPDHKDHFKCHIFKKKPDDEVNKQKEILERLNHCTERYIFNQAVANNYREIDVFSKRKYLFKTVHIELMDSEFMETAYKFAVECCEKLKWIYAFTYFTELKNKKDAFEFSLGDYEKYKQNLLKMIAVDLKQFIEEVQKAEKENLLSQQHVEVLKQKFRTLKMLIVNYYNCTKNFKEKFVKELKNITEILDSQKEKEEMKNYKPQVLQKVRSNDSKDEMIQEDKKQEEKGGLVNSIVSAIKGNRKKKR